MNGLFAFTKKELLEAVRTYRLLIMVIVFLLFGVMNPLTAKLIPVLVESFLPEGMVMNVPEPTAMDSWMQFFKNVPQLGLAVVAILYSTMMSNEFSRGTLINMLTKGLSRSSVVLAKLIIAMFTFTISYLLCFLVSWAYTNYFWKNNVENLAFSIFCVWLFGLLLLAALILGGVIFKSSYGSLLFTGGFVCLLFLVGIIPKIQQYLPVRLVSDNLALLTGGLTCSDFAAATVISCLLIICFTGCAMALFNKKMM